AKRFRLSRPPALVTCSCSFIAAPARPKTFSLLHARISFSPRRSHEFKSVILFVDGSFTVVAVAQLVESRIVIPVVVGSSPIGHPNQYAVFEAYAKAQNGDNRHSEER